MKYFIQTYGCQMNVADSEFMSKSLNILGMTPSPDKEGADLIVVNTCTVRQHAEDRALSFLGIIRKLKIKNSKLKIVFTGCAAERLGQQLKKRFPYIDEIIGAKDIESFPYRIKSLIKHKSSNKKSQKGRAGVTSMVTIMRGCENFCSYCIVPYVRGKEQSISPGQIVRDIELKVKNGLKEIMLLGQNVNSYCYKETPSAKIIRFPELLEIISHIKGIERIRFMTSHPKDLSASLINIMASLAKVANHIHLPLQSGSDKILKKMNRKYTVKDYTEKINLLRKKIPGIAITTDIIVGFPGETQKDFLKTVFLIKKTGFDFLFAFKYSPRAGTKADSLEDNVSKETKESRHGIILSLIAGISREKNAKLMGKTFKILIEGCQNGRFFGRTSSNKKVFVDSSLKYNSGDFLNIRVTGYKVNSLSGIPLK